MYIKIPESHLAWYDARSWKKVLRGSHVPSSLILWPMLI